VMVILTVFTFVMRFGSGLALRGQHLNSPGTGQANGKCAEIWCVGVCELKSLRMMETFCCYRSNPGHLQSHGKKGFCISAR